MGCLYFGLSIAVAGEIELNGSAFLQKSHNHLQNATTDNRHKMLRFYWKNNHILNPSWGKQ